MSIRTWHSNALLYIVSDMEPLTQETHNLDGPRNDHKVILAIHFVVDGPEPTRYKGAVN